MRDLLQRSLGKSLSALTPLDRLATAWPVAAGHAIASRTAVVALDGTIAHIQVPDTPWLLQLRSMTGQLTGELRRVSNVPLTDILFLLPTTDGTRKPGNTP